MKGSNLIQFPDFLNRNFTLNFDNSNSLELIITVQPIYFHHRHHIISGKQDHETEVIDVYTA